MVCKKKKEKLATLVRDTLSNKYLKSLNLNLSFNPNSITLLTEIHKNLTQNT